MCENVEERPLKTELEECEYIIPDWRLSNDEEDQCSCVNVKIEAMEHHDIKPENTSGNETDPAGSGKDEDRLESDDDDEDYIADLMKQGTLQTNSGSKVVIKEEVMLEDVSDKILVKKRPLKKKVLGRKKADRLPALIPIPSMVVSRDAAVYTCLLCSADEKFTTDAKGATHHLKLAHDINMYFCDMCGQEFLGHIELSDHLNTHNCSVDGRHQCEVCHRLFSHLRSLRLHKHLCHSKKKQAKKWKCNQCGKSFLRGLTLKEAIDLLTADEGESYDNLNVYIAPPEPSLLTDEDSADDDEGGLVDNLSGRQLLSDAEIRFPNHHDKVLPSYNDSFDEENYTSVSTTPVISRNIASDIMPTTSSAHVETVSVGIVNNTGLAVNTVNTSNYKQMKYNVIHTLQSEKQAELAAKKKKIPLKKKTWIEGDIESSKAVFPNADFSRYKDFSAVQLFELFFDEDLFEMIAQESNNYALLKNYRHPNITKNELKCFFGILLFTGYHTLPGKRYYWASQPDMHVSFVSNAMGRSRFEQIMQFFHLADNRNIDNNDKLFKLRPAIKKLKENYLKHFIPVQNLSYNESMIEYFGRHGCKQSIRNKPIRFGYKVWCINTVPGYLINFEVYQGKSLSVPTTYEHVFGKPSAVLVTLMDELPEDKSKLPFRLYFDNLFTNMYLLRYLKEIGYSGSGTLREDRIPKSCPLTAKTEMKKKPRGYFEHALCKEDGVLICKWHENGVVNLATNCHGVEPVTRVNRYSVEQKKHILVQRPAVITEYNKHMGGVDKMDENVGRYRIAIRSKKWYWPILTWFIDISVQNAWHLRRSSGNDQPQLDFRRELVQCYLSRYGVQSKGPGRPISSKRSISLSRVSDDIRYDGMDHLVVATPEKKKKRCAGEGCCSIMRTMCKKCDVGLCIDCFSWFHTKTY